MGRREELEAKLIENLQDREARVVYADFLQTAGDPRGELIMLQYKEPAEVEAFFEAHQEALLGPLARYATTFDGSSDEAFVWHLGFIRSAKFGYDSNTVGDVEIADGPDIALEVGIAELLRHPSGMLLEQLVVTINMLDDGSYFDPIVKAIAAAGAPSLRKLRLGEFTHAGPGGAENSDYEYEMSWTSLGDASGMWSKLPRLEELVLQVGLGGSSAESTEDAIGALELPKLKRLEVITGGMSQSCMQSFGAAKLPEATYIDLWFGSANYGAGGTVQDLAPLLAGTHVPKLVHLGLMNSEISDSICEALASSAILPRLTELSLAYGTMTDAGAQALAANRAALGKLETLDVRANCLTEAGISLLRGCCPSVLADEQKSDDERYVSLAE